MKLIHEYENSTIKFVTVQSGLYLRLFTNEQWDDLVWLGDYLGIPLLLDKMPAIEDFKRLVSIYERTYAKK